MLKWEAIYSKDENEPSATITRCRQKHTTRIQENWSPRWATGGRHYMMIVALPRLLVMLPLRLRLQLRLMNSLLQLSLLLLLELRQLHAGHVRVRWMQRSELFLVLLMLDRVARAGSRG